MQALYADVPAPVSETRRALVGDGEGPFQRDPHFSNSL